jgi:hypothetical protein
VLHIVHTTCSIAYSMPEGEAVAHVALAPCLLSGSGSPIGGHKEALSRIHEAEAVYSHCFGSSRLLKPRLPAARSGAGTLFIRHRLTRHKRVIGYCFSSRPPLGAGG